jgi:hypothetical protein
MGRSEKLAKQKSAANSTHKRPETEEDDDDFHADRVDVV